MAVDEQQFSEGNSHLLFDAALIDRPSQDFFSAKFWQAQGALLGTAVGRSSAYFFAYAGEEYLLRHYRRGGLVQRLVADRYLWRGLSGSRAWREWRLLSKLWQRGLPVPRPVAAQVVRCGLYYRADLITLRLPNTETLADRLLQHPLDDSVWQRLGEMVRQFHNEGVYHADLNARNILLDRGDRLWLIDFDRGEIRSQSGAWREKNLARLQRSLNKFRRIDPAFNYTDVQWERLLSAYSGDSH